MMDTIIISRVFCYVLVGLLISSCSDNEQTLNGPSAVEPVLPPSPYGYNSPSGSDEVITLGRVLFYDKILSGDYTTACSSCHKQSHSFSDDKRFSNGHGDVVTDRNAIAIQNVSWEFTPDPSLPSDNYYSPAPPPPNAAVPTVGGLLWDGGESSILKMVLRPVENFNEMGNAAVNDAMARVLRQPYYTKLLKDAFDGAHMTINDKVARALEAFVESISTTDTRYDQYRSGKINLSAAELNGMLLFKNKYNCDGCHQVDNLGPSTARFANTGLDLSYDDPGLARVTGASTDVGKFKVPSLRNIEFTAPYMHDGRFATIEQCIQHYNGGIVDHPNLHPELRDQSGAPLRLNISPEETSDIVAFLRTLSDPKILSDPRFSDPFSRN